MKKTRTLFIASDHAGFDLKSTLVRSQIALKCGFEFKDLGPSRSDRVDYPDYSEKLVTALLNEKPDHPLGVLICGSGQGMAMSANRHKKIRAALAWNEESAQLSRAHNDANILCLGARLIDPSLALKVLEVFLTTEFEGGRHTARIEKF